ncbi:MULTISPECIES: LysE/ArgO family amino acid transporter [Streptomyces]|uniref:LysE/ArgO family amino acid transporter n=1 Tax=Streptomyces TaxID=1883 RepID=UPI0022720872|nr:MULTISPECIES: LysE/ArgO family amino acid transporter [unclassified Streptomyces]MCY0942038.1 LysE/ArgO family amino acid transporter [Streptomyces sp. H34-AA3]MCY0950642.1 LysE/ArgO family amino acid transporter [Streptomyces sp. H27-S2]MCZ4081944.1 LysE/ArgO family amino acid transporter [Streptomyces sp. H34-S5]
MTHGIITAALAGFGTGLSLIMAIGAQNAFVLRQGARRHAVLPVVAICAVSDALLIALGVAGVGAFVTAWPAALTVVGLAGGTFLIGYGILAARRVLRPAPGAALTADGAAPAPGSARRAVLTCLAMTWLNPHVYLDTVLLVGSLAADRGDLRWVFGIGAAVSSLAWFGTLGYGARLLSGLLSRPAAWRVLDGFVAVTMVTMGGLLLARA